MAQRRGVDRHIVKDLGGRSAVNVVEKCYTGERPEVYGQAIKKTAGAAGQGRAAAIVPVWSPRRPSRRRKPFFDNGCRSGGIGRRAGFKIP